ncbi:MAG: hypothetical protein DI576_14985 [Actinomyces sp.]|nr:MAG: hypothetical protein DI576_14985 [Actinomyces sp.]
MPLLTGAGPARSGRTTTAPARRPARRSRRPRPRRAEPRHRRRPRRRAALRERMPVRAEHGPATHAAAAADEPRAEPASVPRAVRRLRGARRTAEPPAPLRP